MSADKRHIMLLCALGASLAMPVWAQEGTEGNDPDAAFLEYLGMWEGSDDEWILIDELVIADAEESPELPPKSEESTETEDES
jgi:hypothetical protein